MCGSALRHTYASLWMAAVYVLALSCKPSTGSRVAHASSQRLEELDRVLAGRLQIGMEVEFARLPMGNIVDQFDFDSIVAIHGKAVLDSYLDGYLDSPAAWEELKNNPNARDLVAKLTDGLTLQNLVTQVSTPEVQAAERGFGEVIMSRLRPTSQSSRPEDSARAQPGTVILGPGGRPVQTGDSMIVDPRRRLGGDASGMEDRYGIRSTGGTIQRSLAADWGILSARWTDLPVETKREFATVHNLSLTKKIELVRERTVKGPKKQRLKNAEMAPLRSDAHPLLRRLGYGRDGDAIEWAHLDPVRSLVEFFRDVQTLTELGQVQSLIADPLRIIGKGVASLQYHLSFESEEGSDAFDTKVRLLNKLMMLEKLAAGILMDLGEEGLMT